MNEDFAPDPAALWMCQLPGMTPALLQHLLAACGSVAAIMQTSSSALRELGVAPGLIAKIVAGPRQVPQVAAGLKGLQRLGILPVPFTSPHYPQRLHTLQEPPLVLYVQGNWPLAQPLIAIVRPDELEPRVAEPWFALLREVQPHVGIATTQAAPAVDTTPPALLGLPYGLMLARQRLPQDIWRQMSAGATTLLSACPPTAQPDLQTSRALRMVLAALADALVVLLPAPAEADDAIAAAKAIGIPAFAFGAPPRAPVPAALRRLQNGKAGVRRLWNVLGIHPDGSATVQQERLF